MLFFKKARSPASYFLGFLLLSLSLRIGKAILSYFYPELPKIYLQIGLSGCFLIGPSLYFFIRAALGQVKVMPTYWRTILWACIIIISAWGIITPYSKYPGAWNNYIVHVIYTQWFLFMLLATWAVRSLVIKIFSTGVSLSPSERSILSIYTGSMIIHIIYVLVFFGSFSSIYIGGALFFSLLLYLNIPLFMNRRKENTAFLGKGDPERYANKKINDEQALSLTAKLDKIILEEELYKNPDLKLNDLARKVNISGHQLSQLLNDNIGKSFAAFINAYRIEQACVLIANNKGIKLEEIGYEVGFNSKSTFYTAFKKHTGVTPMLFKEKF
ncbi:MAG: AraC family transcriptional regulator [Sphingobacteriales bacterium]|nr:MAG: AraC family transcriptional regulator [Sphingobacteriales bacterium]